MASDKISSLAFLEVHPLPPMPRFPSLDESKQGGLRLPIFRKSSGIRDGLMFPRWNDSNPEDWHRDVMLRARNMARHQQEHLVDPRSVPIEHDESEVLRPNKRSRLASSLQDTSHGPSDVFKNDNLLPLPSDLNDETWNQEVLLLALELASEEEAKPHLIPASEK